MPGETASRALGKIREVYGIRRLTVNEREKTVRVEFDATRLTEPVVHQLLRRTGLDVVERVALSAPVQAPPADAAVAAAKA
jgi:hypothetical protein